MKLFNINSLKGRLTLSVVVALIGLLALGAFEIIHLRGQLLEDRKATLKATVDIAMTVVKDIQAQESRG